MGINNDNLKLDQKQKNDSMLVSTNSERIFKNIL